LDDTPLLNPKVEVKQKDAEIARLTSELENSAKERKKLET